MIDSSLMTRVKPGTAVDSLTGRLSGDSLRVGLWERFSGPEFAQGRGRSVSMLDRGRSGDAVGVTALRVSAPFTKIASAAGMAAAAPYGTAINLSIDNNETSALRAVSGTRAWSPPD